jgi:hypothetical protein
MRSSSQSSDASLRRDLSATAGRPSTRTATTSLRTPSLGTASTTTSAPHGATSLSTITKLQSRAQPPHPAVSDARPATMRTPSRSARALRPRPVSFWRGVPAVLRRSLGNARVTVVRHRHGSPQQARSSDNENHKPCPIPTSRHRRDHRDRLHRAGLDSCFGHDRGGRHPPPDAAPREHRLLPLTRPWPVELADIPTAPPAGVR